MSLPNVRRLFTPDPGFIIADADLDRADLQVVVWEADDADLKRRLHLGVDLHLSNAFELEGHSLPPEDELIPGQVRFPTHMGRFKSARQFAKKFIHGTNYGGSAATMARTCGISVRQSELFQNRWFGAHPGVRRWHDRTRMLLQTTREVHNAFGFKRYYFDRIESCLPEALAWVPQSTVAIVINKAWLSLTRAVPQVSVLLQVHDSLVFQYPKSLDPSIRPAIRDAMEVIVPYPDPLIIPLGLKISEKSWGECKGVEWE